LQDLKLSYDSVRRLSTNLSEIDHLTDLYLWRIGPEHLGAILSIATARARGPEHYRRLLGRFPVLSHVTVEVRQAQG
jgi:Co/Zn/Cd efflux system component